MTKDEADERVQAAKDRALDAARKLHAKSKKGCAFGETFGEIACAELAFRELDQAEAARAALDKPRLVTPEERVATAMKQYRTEKLVGECAVMVDRADILAQAEKLPKYTLSFPLHRVSGDTDDFTIKFSDLRNLIQGT